jgi:2-polyprenyl-3-methyl-5-hydroxy-6-metoxy-1,4-benzoquinol methylase
MRSCRLKIRNFTFVVQWRVEHAGCGRPTTGVSSGTSPLGNFLRSRSQRSEHNQNHSRCRTTVDQAELRKFAALSSHWWNDTTGPFAPLHSMNQVRVPLIRDSLLDNASMKVQTGTFGPLGGKTILDVGCGGGILSEGLARLGADVLGVDAGAENVAVATKHAALDPMLQGRLQYRCTTAEALVEERAGDFDCVVSSEVIEHVSDIEQFAEVLSRFVKVCTCDVAGASCPDTSNSVMCSQGAHLSSPPSTEQRGRLLLRSWAQSTCYAWSLRERMSGPNL